MLRFYITGPEKKFICRVIPDISKIMFRSNIGLGPTILKLKQTNFDLVRCYFIISFTRRTLLHIVS